MLCGAVYLGYAVAASTAALAAAVLRLRTREI
jgi:hypothetical protein